MIAYVKGSLVHRAADHVIIETGGVGYRVFVPPGCFGHACEGEAVTAYTHQHFREDDVSLYGFADRDSLGIFEMLLSVTGVGPKVALSLVSSVSPAEFCIAVVTDDAKTLSRAQGVGAKVAQRIILELKDRVKKEQLPGGANAASRAAAGTGTSTAGAGVFGVLPQKQSESISAMMYLGYNSAEAYNAVMKVYDESLPIEEIIKLSLKQMAKR